MDTAPASIAEARERGRCSLSTTSQAPLLAFLLLLLQDPREPVSVTDLIVLYRWGVKAEVFEALPIIGHGSSVES